MLKLCLGAALASACQLLGWGACQDGPRATGAGWWLQVRIHDHTLEAALVLFRTFSADQTEAGQPVFQEDLYVSGA